METNKSRVKLSFEVVGAEEVAVTGQKPPIILLHGLTSAKETWSKIMNPLAVATGRKVYAYDARNHGDSGWSPDFSYALLQDDLIEFMDSLHIKKAVLIGHSMGGKTSMFFASKMPDRVEKLVVEDISPKPSEPYLRIQAQKYVDLLKGVIEQIPPEMEDLEEAKNFVHEYLQEKIRESQRSTRHGTTDGSSLPLTRDENGKFRWKTNLEPIGESFLSAPSTSAVNGVFPGPTLILYGTKSPYKVSSDREYIRRMFPDSQFRAIEGATHQLHLEYEEIFVQEVVEFINDT